jgi:hypothetical protein
MPYQPVAKPTPEMETVTALLIHRHVPCAVLQATAAWWALNPSTWSPRGDAALVGVEKN